MSTDRLLQHPERDTVAEPGQTRRDEQLAEFNGWPLLKDLPLLMTPADLQRVFQIRPSYYFKLQALGRFTRFEAPSVLGAGRGERKAVRYSGAKVRDFLLHGGAAPRTFGGKRGPRAVQVNRVAQLAHDRASVTPTADERKSNSVAAQGNCGGGR